MTPAEFWELTPSELADILDGLSWRLTRTAFTTAWASDAIERRYGREPLPSLGDVIDEFTRPVDEAALRDRDKAALRAWATTYRVWTQAQEASHG